MDMRFKEQFIRGWEKYFNNAELPITFYYTDQDGRAELVKPGTQARCLMGPLRKVRCGNSFTFNEASVGCGGGQTYLGFCGEGAQKLEQEIEYFLSRGIPGEMEGERYKKSAELVREQYSRAERFQAPHQYAVFKRWDNLEAADDPQVVILHLNQYLNY